MKSRLQAENQVAQNAIRAEMSGNAAVDHQRQAFEQHFYFVVGELKHTYAEESETE